MPDKAHFVRDESPREPALFSLEIRKNLQNAHAPTVQSCHKIEPSAQPLFVSEHEILHSSASPSCPAVNPAFDAEFTAALGSLVFRRSLSTMLLREPQRPIDDAAHRICRRAGEEDNLAIFPGKGHEHG